jgi:plastocyanin
MSVRDASSAPQIGWGRSLAASGLAFAVLAAVAGLWIAGRPSRALAPGPGGVALSGFDYGFSPGRITWRVGERVTLTFTNDSSGVPGKRHELMMGRGPATEDTVFGPRFAGGFVTDFFRGVDVEVLQAEKLSMLMPGDARVSGNDMTGMQMGGVAQEAAPGFMVMLQPGGQVTIRFVVPDRPGRWEFGCFQQSGQHYENGMKGSVVVERA